MEPIPATVLASKARFIQALQQQTSLLENPNSPILQAYYRFCRKAMGVKSFSDLKLETQQLNLALVFISQYDYLFDLLIHNRFDLLYQLYRSLGLMQRGHHRAFDYVEPTAFFEVPKKQTYSWLSSRNPNEVLALLEADHQMLRLAKLAYYERALKQLHSSYLFEKQQLFLGFIDKLSQISTKGLSQKAKAEFDAFKAFLTETKHRLEALGKENIFNSDSSINQGLFEKIKQAQNRLKEQIQQKAEALCKSHGQECPEQVEQIRRAQAEFDSEEARIDRQFAALKAIFENSIRELALEFKGVYGEQVHRLIDALGKIQEKTGDLGLKNITASMDALNRRINKATNLAELQSLLLEASKLAGEAESRLKALNINPDYMKILQQAQESFKKQAEPLKTSPSNNCENFFNPESTASNAENTTANPQDNVRSQQNFKDFMEQGRGTEAGGLDAGRMSVLVEQLEALREVCAELSESGLNEKLGLDFNELLNSIEWLATTKELHQEQYNKKFEHIDNVQSLLKKSANEAMGNTDLEKACSILDAMATTLGSREPSGPKP